LAARILSTIVISGLIACNTFFSGHLQAKGNESSNILYVILNKSVNQFDKLHIVVLVDSDNIDRSHLEELFRILTKNTDSLSSIYIDVWDDKQAWEVTRSDFGVQFLTPEQYRSADNHHRAVYGKRNTPPVVESYSFYPAPGSHKVTINLISGKEEAPQKEKAEQNYKSNIVVASITYRQVPDTLYIAIDAGSISAELMTRAACSMVEKYPSLSSIHYFDSEEAAKAASAFYNLPLKERSSEKDASISPHYIAVYNRRGDDRGFLSNFKTAGVMEVNERACKSASGK
jgi:hypothetical protein